MADGRKRLRPWLIALAGVLLVCAIAVALAWVWRIPIAGWAAQRWCTSNDLICRFEITQLSRSRIEARNLSIENIDGREPLDAERASVDLRWDGLFSPVVTRVEVTGPVIRGRYDPAAEPQFELGGLERLAGSGDGSGATWPRITVTDARMEAGTPAGPLTLTGQFDGQLPYQGRLQAEIEPANLEEDGNRLDLREGVVDIDYAGVRLNGTISLDLAEAAFDGVAANDVQLTMDVSGALNPEIGWSATIGAMRYRSYSLESADLSGTFRARRNTPEDAEGLLADIGEMTVQGDVGTFGSASVSAGASSLSLNLSRAGADALTAEFALESEEAQTPAGLLGRATLTGDVQSDDAVSDVRATGDLVIEGARLNDTVQGRMRRALELGPPVDAHAEALSRWLGRALSDLDLGTGLQARWGGRDDWSVVTTRALSLKTPDGATVTLEAQDTQPSLNLSPGMVEFAGLLDISGGRAPQMAALVRSIRIPYRGSLAADLGGVSIEPWTAGDLTLSLELNELLVDTSGSTPRLRTVGEVRLDGPAYGMQFDRTRLFGGAEAVFDASGIRMQAHKTRCLGVDSEGVGLTGGVSIGETAFQACPVDGRIVRRANGLSSGTFDLGSISAPFETQDTSGTLSLDEARLTWQSGNLASIEIDAARMNIPLSLRETTLEITSASPRLSLTSGNPAKLSATLGRTEFSGSLLPADISLATADLDARLAPGGLQGAARANTVEVRDRRQDPLYEPLTGELTADFLNGVMRLRGPVTTPRAGRTIANVDLTLDLSSLDGEARVTTPTLTFQPGRLQPTALSERVRGFLSNARGDLKAEAQFEIDGGSPAGTGWVSVSDFGFDTFRLGAIENVNGRIEFDDVMALSTPPGQTVTIGRISPGVPLENGEISFQLQNGREATIERARWPFAGGELVTAPSDWTLAGTNETIRVSANGIELARLIEVFNLPDINADGTVSGTFPVEIEGPNAYIRGATLTADNKGGTIAYTGGVAKSASQADDRVRMAFDALRDFRFSVLEVGADGNLSGDILITMKLVGRSPDVLDGAPFAFNIGIDSKLMQLIQSGRRATSSNWLADVVAESVGGGNADDAQDVDESE